MALVESLLTAMIRADGDALVMHVGERPYVVVGAGTLDLSSQILNLGAMTGMLQQLLPSTAQDSLEEFGAVEHRLPPHDHDAFTVVAARGGDDIWIEIRRRRNAAPVAAAAPPPPPVNVDVPPALIEDRPALVAAAPIIEAPPVIAELPQPVALAPEPELVAAAPEPMPAIVEEAPVMAEVPVVEMTSEIDDALLAELAAAEDSLVVNEPLVLPEEPAAVPEPMPVIVEEAPVMAEAPIVEMTPEIDEALLAELAAAEDPPVVDEPLVFPEEPAVALLEELLWPRETVALPEPVAEATVEAVSSIRMEEPIAMEAPVAMEEPIAAMEEPIVAMEEPIVAMEEPIVAMEEPIVAMEEPIVAMEESIVALEAPVAMEAPVQMETPVAMEVPVAAPAAPILQMTRTVRIEVPPRAAAGRGSGVERLLRLAAARAASALFVTSDCRPSIRVEGDIRPLDGEPPMSRADVESAVMEIVPESAQDAVGRGESTEWITEFADLGRVRCITFTDHRGPGVVFRMIATRAATAEQLGLSREVQALATEPQGLVLVAGLPGNGKSTLVSALVDLVNRQRAEYVVTLERQIRLVHDNRTAIVSQREIRGGVDEALSAARAALREDPDVLVVDDLASAHMVPLLLEAASEGLVFVSITAPSTIDAVERFVELAPADARAGVQAAMAETFRGAVAQVLLKKSGGGRVAAREVLLATAAVTRVISDGTSGQLQAALEGGRKHGMVPLADALVALVHAGVVDAREAFRKSPDRDRLLAGLKREGIDTSVVERLA